MELTEEQMLFKSGIKKRRRGRLDELMESDAGRQAIDEMVMFIASRASAVSAAARIGVNPNTLSKWLSRGKQEEEGVYRELWDRVVIALGQATAEAEVELNQMNPKSYLTQGPGRILLGDLYNTKLPNAEYNVDGTIGLSTNGHNPTGITEQDTSSEQKSISDQKERDEQNDKLVMLDALKAMRDSGIDINNVIDDLVSKNISKKVSDDDLTVEAE